VTNQTSLLRSHDYQITVLNRTCSIWYQNLVPVSGTYVMGITPSFCLSVPFFPNLSIGRSTHTQRDSQGGSTRRASRVYYSSSSITRTDMLVYTAATMHWSHADTIAACLQIRLPRLSSRVPPPLGRLYTVFAVVFLDESTLKSAKKRTAGSGILKMFAVKRSLSFLGHLVY